MLRKWFASATAFVGRMIGFSWGSGFASALQEGAYVRPRNDYELVHAYGSNARLRTPVECIAEDVASAISTLRLVRVTYDRQGLEIERPVRNHALMRLLQKPHPAMTLEMWVELCCEFYLVTGKSPIRMEEFDAIGRPGKLTVFPPHLILDLPKKSNGYRFQVLWGDGPEWVPASEILWWYDPDLLAPYGDGCGRARAIDDAVYQDTAMSDYINAYFRSGCFGGAVVNVPGLGDAALEEFEKKFTAKRTGLRNAFRSFATNAENPITVANLAPRLRDLDFANGREQVRDQMLQAYQVTRERAGVTKDTSRGNLEGSDFHHQSKNVKPLLAAFVSFLNVFLLPRFDLTGNLRLKFDDPVKESEEARRLFADTGIRTGVMTVDEARGKLGLPPLPNGAGNVLYIPVNNVVVVPADGDIVAAAQQATDALNGRQSDPPPTDEDAG